MPVIACKLGFTQQVVGGATYRFNFDEKFGLHVAHVHDLTHAACFLSVAHYEEVKPEEARPEPVGRTEKPQAGKVRKRRVEPVKQPEMSAAEMATPNQETVEVSPLEQRE